MYSSFEHAINLGGYSLPAMLAKIDAEWARGTLTDAERESLYALARERAVPADSLAPLAERVGALERRVAALEQAAQPEPEPGPGEPEEWPGFVQPTGAHDAYNTGDQVTYQGKRYRCTMDGCVWAPDVYPAAWEEVPSDGDGDEAE